MGILGVARQLPGLGWNALCAFPFIFLHCLSHGSTFPQPSPANASVRVWVDTVFFSPGEVDIVKDIISNSSGRMALTGETLNAFLSVKGAYVPQSWELYWTARRACYASLGAIAPPKRVNCIPGLEAVAYKQSLVRTVQEAYGEAAFEYFPRSYILPTQYWVWRSWTQRTGCPDDLPWVLKANDHRGRGVKVMRQRQAQSLALAGGDAKVPNEMATQKGFVLVQSYVRQQFLYDNRPSYLRLWVVVTSVRPLRVYLFRGGVLVIGDRLGTAAGGAADDKARARRRGGGGGGGGRGRRQLLDVHTHELPGLRGHPWVSQMGASDDPPQGRRSLQQQQLEQQQQQQTGSASGPKQRYEMHQVNYFTIAGEKVQPWTVRQLREYAEATWPDDPRVFDRMWAHARSSVGMVFAAAARRMRASARNLGALDGCGFEIMGVDFVLNATLHPTLVEVNASPSLARLRIAPGDPGRQGAAAGGAAGSTGASGRELLTAEADGGGAPPFNLEKERLLEHALRLLGLPIPPPPVRGDGSNGTSAWSTGGSAAATGPSSPDSAGTGPSLGGVLRAMAALLRPPNNETTELQAFLRLHWPQNVAAAAAALPSLRPMLCPVPAAWGAAPGWPTLDAAADAGTAAGSEGAAAAGGGRRLAAVEETAADMAVARRPKRLRDLSRQVALGKVPQRKEGAAHRIGVGVRAGIAAARPRHQGRGRESNEAKADAAVLAAASASAANMAAKRGLDERGRLEEIRFPDLRHEVATAQGSLQDGTSSASSGSSSGSRIGSGSGSRAIGRDIDSALFGGGVREGKAARGLRGVDAAAAAGACPRRCYDWEMLASLADTQLELEQGLDFDPIFPLAAAHELNKAALEVAQFSGGGSSGQGSGPRRRRGRTDGTGYAAPFDHNSAADDAGGFRAAQYNPQTKMQRLKTGLGFIRESITTVNMDMVRSMQYMTTTPYIYASTKVPYGRVDATLTAFEAVRARPNFCGAGAGVAASSQDGGVGGCAVRVLQETLDELCSGRINVGQE